MSIFGVSSNSTFLADLIVNQKREFETKSTQLVSGKVSQTYGGLGEQRHLNLSLKSEVGRIEAYQTSGDVASIHLKTLNTTLERMEELRREAVSAIDPNSYVMTTDGQTTSQATAEIAMREVVSLLNTDVSGYYLYGGGDAKGSPVASFDEIMEGDGSKMGLKQVMDAFSTAHLGPSGQGRLDTAVTSGGGTATVTLSELSTGDFGFKIAGVSATGAAISTNYSAAAGATPADASATLNAQPLEGDAVTFDLTLPDGTSKKISLTATSEASGEPGTFQIGADVDQTAANLDAALKSELSDAANTDLKAVSDQQAGAEFFGTYDSARDPAVPYLPDASGEALVDGSAQIFEWYQGDVPEGDARSEKFALIDNGLKVEYGASAQERGFAELLQGMAVFVAADFQPGTSGSDPEAVAREYYSALSERTDSDLSVPDNRQSGVQSVAVEMSISYKTVENTSDRLDQKKLTYEQMIGGIENVDKEQTATELLQIQTNLETSYAVTTRLLSLSLSNYF
ncbi:hypothetical protein [Pseudovibrio sp. SPO723]|uniref:hypothetical protein n=1 Tax=Nesiotobacter zosterae TaxID=392721 RepID=UPI0029C5A5D0|nr:hypothetical protein [Pseudovibrio sp. SPO723]MDX5594140.1 hypothetical protein [Pseudovibrio sp. SPO723]